MLDYLQIFEKNHNSSFLQDYKVHIADQASLKGENTKINSFAWYILIDQPVSCVILTAQPQLHACLKELFWGFLEIYQT